MVGAADAVFQEAVDAPSVAVGDGATAEGEVMVEVLEPGDTAGEALAGDTAEDSAGALAATVADSAAATGIVAMATVRGHSDSAITALMDMRRPIMTLIAIQPGALATIHLHITMAIMAALVLPSA